MTDTTTTTTKTGFKAPNQGTGNRQGLREGDPRGNFTPRQDAQLDTVPSFLFQDDPLAFGDFSTHDTSAVATKELVEALEAIVPSGASKQLEKGGMVTYHHHAFVPGMVARHLNSRPPAVVTTISFADTATTYYCIFFLDNRNSGAIPMVSVGRNTMPDTIGLSTLLSADYRTALLSWLSGKTDSTYSKSPTGAFSITRAQLQDKAGLQQTLLTLLKSGLNIPALACNDDPHAFGQSSAHAMFHKVLSAGGNGSLLISGHANRAGHGFQCSDGSVAPANVVFTISQRSGGRDQVVTPLMEVAAWLSIVQVSNPTKEEVAGGVNPNACAAPIVVATGFKATTMPITPATSLYAISAVADALATGGSWVPLLRNSRTREDDAFSYVPAWSGVTDFPSVTGLSNDDPIMIQYLQTFFQPGRIIAAIAAPVVGGDSGLVSIARTISDTRPDDLDAQLTALVGERVRVPSIFTNSVTRGWSLPGVAGGLTVNGIPLQADVSLVLDAAKVVVSDQELSDIPYATAPNASDSDLGALYGLLSRAASGMIDMSKVEIIEMVQVNPDALLAVLEAASLGRVLPASTLDVLNGYGDRRGSVSNDRWAVGRFSGETGRGNRRSGGNTLTGFQGAFR